MSRLDRIYSATDQTPPAAPSGITAQALSSQAILVQWLPVTDASGVTYTLERGDGTLFSVIQSGLSATQYTDSVPRGSHFHYRVKAVDGASNEGPYSVDVEVSTPANTDPEWSPGVTGFSVPSNAAIGTVVADLSLYASDADGDELTITQTSGTLPSGLSYSPTTKRITVTGTLSAGATADVTYAADDGYNTAAEDWLLRSTGPGVIWAHRFSSETDGSLYWAQNGNNPGAEYGSASTGAHFGYLGTTPINGRSDGGIIGDGCMEFYIPGGQGTPVSGGWRRPLAPVRADSGTSGRLPYAADTNNPGLDFLPFDAAYSFYARDPNGRFGNCPGGYFTHPSYWAARRSYTLGGASHPEIVSDPEKVTEGIYLQYRVKFPTLPNGDNRLDYTDFWGKLVMFSNMGVSNANNEIITNVMPQAGYNNRFFMYNTTGGVPLYSPVNGSSVGTIAQPGGDYDATCRLDSSGSGSSGACWVWPKDEWVTVLMQVVPGRNNTNQSYLTSPQFPETAIRVWVARAGATSYTKIWDKADYGMNYQLGSYPFSDFTYATGGNNPLAGTAAPYGYNAVRFDTYANPGQALAKEYSKGIWVLHDQIICSTRFIPCPRV